MKPFFRWFVRVCSLLILAGVWQLLPHVLPGASRITRLFEVLVLAAAVILGVITFVVSFARAPMVPRQGTRKGAIHANIPEPR